MAEPVSPLISIHDMYCLSNPGLYPSHTTVTFPVNDLGSVNNDIVRNHFPKKKTDGVNFGSCVQEKIYIYNIYIYNIYIYISVCDVC